MNEVFVGNTQLVAGGVEMVPAILALLESAKVSVHANPDLYVREYRHFGIDEAREIREKSAARALQGRRYFIIAASVMTSEAQNALLKMLEEAPGDAMFFLVTPSPEMLLPTVRSRAQMLELIATKQKLTVDPAHFLASPRAARLDMLKALVEKGDDDKRDVSGIVRFLSALESVLSQGDIAQNREGIAAVYRARAYLGDKGALVKPLLEQVALLAPKM